MTLKKNTTIETISLEMGKSRTPSDASSQEVEAQFGLGLTDVAVMAKGQQGEKSGPQVSTAEQHDSTSDHTPGLSKWRRVLICTSLCSAIVLCVMDTSITATATYVISLEFNSLSKTIWAILAYQLAYAGFAVTFARLSDVFGRRSAILFAFALFVGFSLACGWARNINQMIAFRTLQGIGGMGLFTLSATTLMEVSTTNLLAFTASLIGAAVATAGALGPVVGGLFTEYVSWRWIFWINGPFGGIAALCFVLAWPPTSGKPEPMLRTFQRTWSQFDGVGALLLLAASVLVVFALQEGGTGTFPWSSLVIVLTLVIGLVCWGLLISWSYYVFKFRSQTTKPMLPWTLLTHRVWICGTISYCLASFTYYLIIFSLPLRFQIVNLTSAATAGAYFLPFAVSIGSGSFAAGFILRKKNFISQIFIAGNCLVMFGCGLLSTVGSSTKLEDKCFGFQVIVGFGIGLAFQAMNLMNSLETDSQTHAMGQGLSTQARVLCGSMGVAASNGIFNSTCVNKLQDILTRQQISDLQMNTKILETLDGPARVAVQAAYSDAFQTNMKLCIGIASLGLITSIFTWQKNPPTIKRRS